MSTQSRITQYLSDVSAAMAGADPQEREETLLSLREHLNDELAPHSTDREIDEAFRRLGDPLEIAGAASPAQAPLQGMTQQTTVIYQDRPSAGTSPFFILLWGLASLVLAVIFFPAGLLLGAAGVVMAWLTGRGLRRKFPNGYPTRWAWTGGIILCTFAVLFGLFVWLFLTPAGELVTPATTGDTTVVEVTD